MMFTIVIIHHSRRQQYFYSGRSHRAKDCPSRFLPFLPLPENQSSYREHHSTKTALLKVKKNVFFSMDRQEVTLLVLIDLGARRAADFDTI